MFEGFSLGELAKVWSRFDVPSIAAAASDDGKVLGFDLTIEGLRSQQYSYFIFGFLIVSLIIFSIIIYLYLPKAGQLKKGEKVMLGAIVGGVIFAVFFGWLQLIEGYLI
jgi:hypothetical protein